MAFAVRAIASAAFPPDLGPDCFFGVAAATVLNNCYTWGHDYFLHWEHVRVVKSGSIVKKD